MLVSNIMKPTVITISPMASVREALKLMKEAGVKSLVTQKLHANDAYGLISFNDIAKAIIAEGGDIDLLNVYDIAQKPVLQVSGSLATKYLARLMISYQVKHVLVIEDNELLGFVSMTDVVNDLIDTTVTA